MLIKKHRFKIFSNTCVKRFHTQKVTETRSTLEGTVCDNSLDPEADFSLMSSVLFPRVCVLGGRTILVINLRNAMDYI